MTGAALAKPTPPSTVPTRLIVRLTPRGGRDRIDGWSVDADGRDYLRVRVAAPPVDGEANAALVRLVAKTLGRPASAVRIVAGETARLKQIEIDGVDQNQLEKALGAPR